MASRFQGRLTKTQGAPVARSVKADGNAGDRASWMTSGMSASHFQDDSTKRRGLFSALDSDSRHRNERALNAMPTSMLMAAIDPATGQPVPNATMTMDGKVMRADAQGRFRMVDRGALDIQQRLREERDAQVNQMVEYCLASDATCSDVLGLTPADYETLMATGAAKAGLRDEPRAIAEAADIPADILAYEARVRYLTLYPSDTIEFRRGIAKLRAVTSYLAPFLQGDTGTSETALKAVERAPDE